jgi:hypothetical protein
MTSPPETNDIVASVGTPDVTAKGLGLLHD